MSKPIVQKLDRRGRVRVTFEIEVHVDNGLDPEEGPKDTDFQEDVDAIANDGKSYFETFGEVISVEVQIDEKPPKLAALGYKEGPQ